MGRIQGKEKSMTLEELKALQPTDLVPIKVVADICECPYKLFMDIYLYRKPRIEVVRKNKRVYVTQQEALEFIPAYIRMNK